VELLEMTRGETAASYDVIIAADVFAYLGKLDGIVGEAKRLLRNGGLFAFSIEAIDGSAENQAHPAAIGDYRLSPSGRYVHSRAYLESLAAAQGFEIRRMQSAPIRREKDMPVQGWLTVWEH
jgi:predicted TPR repeat methyltransferase